jgi:hypothetical protein
MEEDSRRGTLGHAPPVLPSPAISPGSPRPAAMASYETPRVDVNAGGWGPTALPEQFLNVPYAPFNKGDKLGKAADFVSNYAPRQSRTSLSSPTLGCVAI